MNILHITDNILQEISDIVYFFSHGNRMDEQLVSGNQKMCWLSRLESIISKYSKCPVTDAKIDQTDTTVSNMTLCKNNKKKNRWSPELIQLRKRIMLTMKQKLRATNKR